ncbi:MarR family winged helix-turn-helix transcriptional regulator [Nocardioides mangrovi]|uniref:MarR family transcriptional regulator n=1 Tax=Nocardioides mangrovi TaxID=2874580 RepID=A0ABS7U7M7_9ACTN|nr:MarR family transcriptional regulator [Nocardioides mangrovi]MBZ5736677.1 MarR family transcriptional regulator [Nocardioides mangrovi]
MTDTQDDRALMDAVVQLSFEVMAVLHQVGAAHDLSATQLRLLGVLRDREPRMADLADGLGLDRSTVSGLIDRAAARGLVERFPDEHDRRSSRVRMTAAGHELAVPVAAAVAERVAALVEPLSRADRATLRALVERALAAW